jgi:hypothetical protein
VDAGVCLQQQCTVSMGRCEYSKVKGDVEHMTEMVSMMPPGIYIKY